MAAPATPPSKNKQPDNGSQLSKSRLLRSRHKSLIPFPHNNKNILLPLVAATHIAHNLFLGLFHNGNHYNRYNLFLL
jgi:hypothetical protein